MNPLRKPTPTDDRPIGRPIHEDEPPADDRPIGRPIHDEDYLNKEDVKNFKNFLREGLSGLTADDLKALNESSALNAALRDE